ncbi:MAG: M67 family metallopeptidase [Dehalococcoidia bacterium]|nr:M67 family metallopeptidase [Dehalococcoidia bacterium]MDP7469210.1 M67 family metallopeptidase [Dehalococcoidia bacterium]
MFRIEGRFMQEMVAHSREKAPNECCGILAGPPGQVAALYRTVNASASPIRYSIDPKEILRIAQEIEGKDWEMTAFYHSHTHSEAYPSATDIRLAFWPDSLYLIVSLADLQQPCVRGFYLRGGQVTEEELETF